MTEQIPDDLELLAATARVWELMDPPPPDLADGVLARIAAEDLELELLTLVESEGLAGVRHAAPEEAAEPDGTGSWQLEYEGGDLRIYLRLSRVEEYTRIDGYVVPAAPMTVQLTSDKGGVQQADVDEHGRFAFSTAEPGLSRVVFTIPGARPRATPPFWI